MCEPSDFYLRVFTFWFDTESIIPGYFGFATGVCILRESRCMSESVYVPVVYDVELLCSSLCNRTTALISHWD